MQTIHQDMRKPPACIWMQAGVVPRKDCRQHYQCRTCSFERAMSTLAEENDARRRRGLDSKGKKGQIVFWQKKLSALPAARRPCVHYMKRQIAFRTCTNGYRCSECAFDQYFEDEFSVHAVVKPVNVLNVRGFAIPQGYYLHPGHAWIKLEEGNTVRVGLDDFAFRLLGPPHRIEAPLLGKAVKQGRPALRLHRGSRSAAALSPVTGIVTAVNPDTRENSRMAGGHPYDKGWILMVHGDNLRSDLKNLVIGDGAADFLEQEVEGVYDLIEETAGPLAADGGFLGKDIYGALPQLDWERLTRRFLRTAS